MLELVFSNRAEALIEVLAERVAARQAGSGFWKPVPIVVPNPLVKRFVREGLAARNGSAANLDFHFLESLFGKALAPRRLWTPELLTGRLLLRFQADALEPAPAAYLAGDREGRKALQLAQRLGKLFHDYALHRPGWIRAWRRGAEAGAAGWQGRLFAEVDGELAGADFVCPADLAEGAEGLAWPEGVLVFSLNTLAPAYFRVLDALKERKGATLFVLNPCEEFWADHGARKDFLAEKEEVLEGHPALGLWGRPGRDFVARLYDLAEGQDDTRFETPGRATLLRAMQDDILAMREPSPFKLGEDRSLRILSAPGPRREAEVVATEIWRLMDDAKAAGRPLRFTDIAVVIPALQAEAYLEHLRAAFDATHKLPLAFESATAGATRLLAEACGMLLDLLASGFDRAAVLRLLRHPASRAALPTLNPDDTLALCERAGILRGLDESAFAGTYLAGMERVHWQQGLARAALGAFLPEGASVRGHDLPAIAAPRESAVALAAWIHRLQGWAREQTRPRPPSEWAAAFMALADVCFGNGEEAWVRAKAGARKQLEAFESLEPKGLQAPRLNFLQARELIAARLSAPGDRPETLPGVRVSTCAPMRAVPFRVIFVMGMAEGIFPAVDRPDPLDLRQRDRQPGDLGRAEQDRYLFLELLLSARDSLRLSYPDADPATGDARPPSAVLQELTDIVAAMTGGAEALTERHPLRRFDDLYFGPSRRLACLAPEAWREAQALAWARYREGGNEVDQAALSALLGAAEWPPSGFPPEQLRVSFPQLRAWLEDPLQGAAQIRLGLRGGDEDAEAFDAEALELDRLGTSQLLQRAVQLGLSEGADGEASVATIWRAMELEGRAPLGELGRLERERAVARIRAWLPRLRELGPLQIHRFGRARDGQAGDVVHPPLTLEVPVEGRVVSVSLEGCTAFVGGSDLAAIYDREDPKPPDLLRRHLRLYADQVILAAAGLSAPDSLRVLLVDKDHARPLPAPDADTARARLGAWLGAILLPQRWEPLPSAYALELAKADPEPPQDWLARRDAARDWDAVPASIAETRPAPLSEAAKVSLALRLGPLLAFPAEDEP